MSAFSLNLRRSVLSLLSAFTLFLLGLGSSNLPAASAETVISYALTNTQQGVYYLPVGNTKQIYIVGDTGISKFRITDRVSYLISDTSIATVDTDGNIYGLKAGETQLVVSYAGLVGGARIVVSAVDPYAGKDEAKQKAIEKQGQQYLNGIRTAMGLPPFTVHAALSQAAQAHEIYLEHAKPEEAASSPQWEVAGSPYFSGRSPDFRAQFFGYPSAQVVEFQTKTGSRIEDSLDLLLASPLKRLALLDPNMTDLGIGAEFANPAGAQVVQVGTAKELKDYDGSVVYYPYPNQTRVPLEWYIDGSPNPLASQGLDKVTVGYPISIAKNNQTGSLEFLSGILKDDLGKEVPSYTVTTSESILLIPKQPLRSGVRYTVSVEAMATDAKLKETEANRTWSFTTVGVPEKLLVKTKQYSMIPGDTVMLESITLGMSDGTEQPADGPLTFSSAQAPIASVDGKGKITAVSTGKTQILVGYQSFSEKIEVTVVAPTPPAPPKEPAQPTPKPPVTPTIPIAPSKLDFPDTASHWAKSEIERLLRLGIVNGFEDGTFRPDEALTREQFVKMLVQLQGIATTPTTADSPAFADVLPTQWSFPYVQAAVAARILLPAEFNKTFNPGLPITRLEMAIWVARALGLPENTASLSFADASSITVHPGLVGAAVSAGILNGFEDQTFRPERQATRAEASVMLTRMADYSKT